MGYKDPDRQREYARIWVARRRAEWIAANGPCVQCGSSERLEVDHIDPKLKIHHAVWSWKRERRETELAKCQILCYECHKAKTILQVSKIGEEGTAWCGMHKAFLPIERFTKKKTTPNGLQDRCRECIRVKRIEAEQNKLAGVM